MPFIRTLFFALFYNYQIFRLLQHFLYFYKSLYFRHLFYSKIQGTYFKISALCFKIYGLYFLRQAMCFFRYAEALEKHPEIFFENPHLLPSRTLMKFRFAA